MSTTKRVILSTSLSVAALSIAVYGIADNMPPSVPLVYSGVLTDSVNKPISAGAVDVKLYTSQTDGSALCGTKTPAPAGPAGQFSVTMEDACSEIVHTNPILWVGISVDGTDLPRSRVSAVPFAEKAVHAITAQVASRQHAAIDLVAMLNQHLGGPPAITVTACLEDGRPAPERALERVRQSADLRMLELGW